VTARDCGPPLTAMKSSERYIPSVAHPLDVGRLGRRPSGGAVAYRVGHSDRGVIVGLALAAAALIQWPRRSASETRLSPASWQSH
jgi:hypothetical protein